MTGLFTFGYSYFAGVATTLGLEGLAFGEEDG